MSENNRKLCLCQWANDDDGSLPKDRFICFYAHRGWDEWGCFPLPSSRQLCKLKCRTQAY